MPPFGVCIKLKTTCEGYVSSPFLLPEYRKYTSNPLLAFRLSREKVGLSTAPLSVPPFTIHTTEEWKKMHFLKKFAKKVFYGIITIKST